MMNYAKIELIKEWLNNYYSVYELTLDTDRYVDSKMNDKILNKIFKFQKKDFKKLIKESKIIEKKHKAELKKASKLDKPKKKNIFYKLKSLFSKKNKV